MGEIPLMRGARIGRTGLVACGVLVGLGMVACRPTPANETASFAFTKGLKIFRSSTDLAGDDAGYFTNFGSPEAPEVVAAKAKAELVGWRQYKQGQKIKFDLTRDDMEFIVGIISDGRGGSVIQVTQRVPEDRM